MSAMVMVSVCFDVYCVAGVVEVGLFFCAWVCGCEFGMVNGCDGCCAILSDL